MKRILLLITCFWMLLIGVSSAQSCISGIIYSDDNNNGQLDIGELGVTNQEVSIVGSDGTEYSTLSTGEGNYEICDLPDDEYTVYLILGSTLLFSNPSSQVVVLTNGQSSTGVNFGLVDGSQLGTISGQVFIDLDGDGVKQLFEPGVNNTPVILVNLADPLTPIVTNTNGLGEFLFSGLVGGEYRLEVQDNIPNTTLSSPQQIDLFLETGGFLTNNKFIFTPFENLGNIVDFVCNDIDANGVNDPETEPGIVNSAVRLLDEMGQEIAVAQTDPNGLYSFIGLSPGGYQVEAIYNEEDYSPTTPTFYELSVIAGNFLQNSPFYFEPLRPQIKCGMAAHSFGKHENNSNSLGIWNTRDRSTATIGTTWSSAPVHRYWTMSQTGTVFGLAFDDHSNLYATATQVFWGPANYPAGSGGIIKIDGTTLGVSNFVTTIPSGNPVGTNTLPNTNAGLGNICYNRTHDKLYVTNIEDGSINVLDPSSGTIIQHYDPFSPDDGIAGPPNDHAEVVWGIAFNHTEDRVYFGRSTGAGSPNKIVYSIGVTATGEIDLGETPLVEVSIAQTTYSNDITDIAFSDDDNSMLVSERGGAHSARVLLYSGSTTSWTFIQKVDIGEISGYNNSAGGVDFGYESFSPPSVEPENCDNWIYASGNALQFGTDGNVTYGFAIAPPNIGPYSGYIFIDANDGPVSTYEKGNLGDVEVVDCPNCPPQNCEGLSVSSSSAIEASGDCCWELSYDNQLGNVYGIRVTALGGVELEYDPDLIGPGLWDPINPGESVTLVPSAGGPLPTGQFNNFFQFCLENIQNTPQQVLVEWLDEDYEMVCDTLFEFECEPVPECLYTSSDTIYCDGPDVIYEFTLTNPPSSQITIGLAKLDVISPTPVAGVYTQGPVSIAPGSSWTGQIVITDGYQLAGQDLCYNIYAHEGPEELYCCFDSTLYCIPIPDCPPCEDVWADLIPLNMENDSTDCCYRLEVTNNFDDMYFTNIQTVITTPGVIFGDIDFPLPHQWSYSNLVYKKDLMWSHSGGGFIPEVAGDFLMDFCLEGITTTDPVEIVVNWFAQDSVVCTQTLYVECNDCMWLENEEIVCGPNGDIEYYFSFYNHSGFTVNAVKFVELGFPNDTIAEDLVFLGQDYPSHDGQLITVGPIHIDPSAGPSPPDFCFNISLRYERPEDSLSIECCHLLHCIELPDCDDEPLQECNALHFDGEDDYVEVNSPFSGNTDFTVEMWFNSESTLVGTCQNNNISDFRWLISWDDEDFGIGDCNGDLRVVFAPLCPGGQNLCTSLPAFPINDNNWHHVAYTKTGTETRIFVDGVFFVNFAGAPYDMSGTFRIGAPGSGNQGRPWEGLIDEIRIWDYARSDDQIAEVFNCGLTGNEQGLVTYFPANEGIPGGDNTALTVLTDQSGNGNDGTLNNFAQNGNSSNWLLGYGEVCSPCEDDVLPPVIDLNVDVININEIVLDWTVSDADWFDFWLRRRFPGSDWMDFGAVLAETGVSTYSFTDPNPTNEGTIEYQIIGTTFEGEEILSNLVMIDLPGPPDVTVYPVPAIQDLIIKVPVEGIYDLQILNSNGVQVQKFKNPIMAEGPVDLDISMLKPGVYFLRLQHQDGTTYLKKFVVMY